MISDITTHQTSIRFTSIEPCEFHSDSIREIANRHGFDAEFNSESTVNAPFCGIDYHIQEVCLMPSRSASRAESTTKHCLDALSTFEQTGMADGYFDIIG